MWGLKCSQEFVVASKYGLGQNPRTAELYKFSHCKTARFLDFLGGFKSHSQSRSYLTRVHNPCIRLTRQKIAVNKLPRKKCSCSPFPLCFPRFTRLSKNWSRVVYLLAFGFGREQSCMRTSKLAKVIKSPRVNKLNHM